MQFTFFTLTNFDFLLLQKHTMSIAEKQKRYRSIMKRIKKSHNLTTHYEVAIVNIFLDIFCMSIYIYLSSIDMIIYIYIYIYIYIHTHTQFSNECVILKTENCTCNIKNCRPFARQEWQGPV